MSKLFEMRLVKEQLPNRWVILEHREECYTCQKDKRVGKLIFDLFMCANCVDSLGAE